MMELWYIYALLSALFAGLYSFFLKISAEKNHDSSLVTAYSMFSSSLIGLILFLFSIESFNPVLILLLASIGNSIFYFIAVTTRIESLKNIDTVIYFPISKTLGPLLMIFVSVFVFSERLSMMELFGILLGIFVPLLLIHKNENGMQLNLKKGLIYLGIGTIFGVLASSTSKIISLNNLNIFLFIFISFFVGGFLSLFSYGRNYLKKKVNSSQKIKRIGILNGVFLFFSVYFFVKSTIGNLGVVYTINSFSILVPIIMSIFIYDDHINWRKGSAIALSILALIFLK